MAWLAGWDKRIKITIDHDDIDGALTNFPILVYLSGASGIGDVDVTAIFDEVGANSLKIAVTEADGETECKVEIEKWDDGAETAWLWVKVPAISADVDTDLYIYYDNDHADNVANVGVKQSAPAEAVWDANFVMVQHLEETGGDASDRFDSTAEDSDLVVQDITDPDAAGKVDGADDFEEDNTDYEDRGDDATLDLTVFTVECIIKIESIPASAADVFIEKREGILGDYNCNWMIQIHNTGTIRGYFGVDGLSYKGITSEAVDAGVFYYVALVKKVDAGLDYFLYINDWARKQLDTDKTPYIAGTQSFTIGASKSTGLARTFDGIIDEVRLSNIAREPEWIAATYESNFDDLATFGTEELLPQDGSAELFCHFISRHDDSEELFSKFIVLNIGEANLPSKFTVRHVGTPGEVFGKFSVRHDGSEELFGKFSVRRSSSQELTASFTVRHATAASPGIKGVFVVRHVGTPVELPCNFTVRHKDEEELSSKFTVRHIGTPVELFGKFSVRRSSSQELTASFTVRQPAYAELPTKFVVRQTDSEDLPASFIVRQRLSVNLFAEFISRHSAYKEQPGEFVVRHSASQDLAASFDVQDSQDLLCEFIVRQPGSADLPAWFSAQTSVDLPAKFIVRQPGSADLPAWFDVARISGSADLPCKFIIRQIDAQNLLGVFAARRSSSQDLSAEFIPRRSSSQDLAAHFIIGQPGSADLLAGFSVKRPGILLDITLEERDIAITLEEREVEITLQERGIAISYRHEGQTMVNLGDTFQLKGECTDLDGNAEDPDSQSIKLYDLEDNLIDTDNSPTEGVPDGEYYANLEAKNTGITGAWIALWEVTVGAEKRTVRFDVEVKSLLG